MAQDDFKIIDDIFANQDTQVNEDMIKANLAALPAEQPKPSVDINRLKKELPATAKVAEQALSELTDEDFKAVGLAESSLNAVKEGARVLNNARLYAYTGLTSDLATGFYGGLETASAVLDKGYGWVIDDYIGKKYNIFKKSKRFFEDTRKGQELRAKGILGKADLGDGPLNGFERNLYSAMRSVGLNAPGLLLGLPMRSAGVALTSAGIAEGGRASAEALDKGIEPITAATYGLSNASIEVGTEFLPAVNAIKNLQLKSPFITFFKEQLEREVPGEMLATLGQKLNDYAVMNPDKTVNDFISELPQDLADTFVSTIIASGVQTGTLAGVNKLAEKVSKGKAVNEVAADTVAMLEEASNVSKVIESKVKNEDLLNQLVENSLGEDVKDVYLDIEELVKDGVNLDSLAEISDTVKKELQNKANVTGDIKIPAAEFVTKILKTQEGKQLLDYVKLSPDLMSKKETEVFMQEAEQELKKITEQPELKLNEKEIEQKEIFDTIKTQLDEAGRFTSDVNKSYAALVSKFYSNNADRLGISVKELYNRLPLKISSEVKIGKETLKQKDTYTKGLLYSGGYVNSKNKFLTPSSVSDRTRKEQILYNITVPKNKVKKIKIEDNNINSILDNAVGSAEVDGALTDYLKEQNIEDVFAVDIEGRGLFVLPEYRDKYVESYEDVPFEKARSEGFYSKLSEAVEKLVLPNWGKKPVKSKMVWDKIKSLNEVKKDELFWSAVEDFLLMRDTVTKKELLAYINSNLPEIKTTLSSEEQGGEESFTYHSEYLTASEKIDYLGYDYVRETASEYLQDSFREAGSLDETAGFLDTTIAEVVEADLHRVLLNSISQLENGIFTPRPYDYNWLKSQHYGSVEDFTGYPEDAIEDLEKLDSEEAEAVRSLDIDSLRETFRNTLVKYKEFIKTTKSLEEAVEFFKQDNDYKELVSKLFNYYNVGLSYDYDLIKEDLANVANEIAYEESYVLEKYVEEYHPDFNVYNIYKGEDSTGFSFYGDDEMGYRSDELSSVSDVYDIYEAFDNAVAEIQDEDLLPDDYGTTRFKDELADPIKFIGYEDYSEMLITLDSPQYDLHFSGGHFGENTMSFVRMATAVDVLSESTPAGGKINNADVVKYIHEKVTGNKVELDSEVLRKINDKLVHLKEQQKEIEDLYSNFNKDDFYEKFEKTLNFINPDGGLGLTDKEIELFKSLDKFLKSGEIDSNLEKLINDVKVNIDNNIDEMFDNGLPKEVKDYYENLKELLGSKKHILYKYFQDFDLSILETNKEDFKTYTKELLASKSIYDIPEKIKEVAAGLYSLQPQNVLTGISYAASAAEKVFKKEGDKITADKLYKLANAAKELEAKYSSEQEFIEVKGLQDSLSGYGDIVTRIFLKDMLAKGTFDFIRHTYTSDTEKAISKMYGRIYEAAINALDMAKYELKVDIENAELRKKREEIDSLPSYDNVLWVDELQSDWHQKGREHGYRPVRVTERLLKEAENIYQQSRKEISQLLSSYDTDIKDFLSKPTLSSSVTEAKAYLLDIINGSASLNTNIPKEWLSAETLHEAARSITDEPAEIQKIVYGLRKVIDNFYDFKIKTGEGVYGLPSEAPFRDDAWIALTAKKLLSYAVANHENVIAFSDSDLLVTKWSENFRNLYENTYDKKLRSFFEKTLKVKAVRMQFEGYDGGYWLVPIPKEKREEIKNNAFPFFQKQGSRVKGTFNPATLEIALSESSDLSTFLHETGHFFLEALQSMANMPEANYEMKKDFQDTMKWLGISDEAQWNAMSLEEKRPYHEKFARGFEAYLFQGKYPDKTLKKIFKRFKTWLKSVYRSIRDLDVKLNKEIKLVFDRLLASEDAIKIAKNDIRATQMLLEETDLSKADWSKYIKLRDEFVDEAEDYLDQKSLQQLQWTDKAKSKKIRELQRQANRVRREIKDEVKDEVLSRPVHKARRFLKNGEFTETNPKNKEQRRLFTAISEGELPHKISTSSLKNYFGEDDTLRQELPKGRYGYVAKKGLDVNVVADMFGYSNPTDLVYDLLYAPSENEELNGRVEQEMLQSYSELSSPEAIEEAAIEALHNEARKRFVKIELDAMNKAMGGKRVLNRAVKNLATNYVEALKIRELTVRRFNSAQSKAQSRAYKARKEGNIAEAVRQKKIQLVNIEIVNRIKNTKPQVDKYIKYLKKFGNDNVRKNIDIDYLDQIDAILSKFDINTSVTLRDLDKRQKLNDWLAELEAVGIEPRIPDYIKDEAAKKHYKDLRVAELQGLVDTIKQIEHLGRLKNKLLTVQDGRLFAEVAAQLQSSIEDNFKGKPADDTPPQTAWEKTKHVLKKFDMEHRKFATLGYVIDGLQDDGVFWNTIIKPMNEAGNKEANMRADTAAKLAKLFKKLEKGGKFSGKGIYFDSIGRSLNRESRIVIALNVGNEGNLQRLLDGEGWTEEQIKPVLDSITPEEADFVQEVWDLFESFKPLIREQERKIYGKEPEWVQPVPVILGGKHLRGGYYPISYDTDRSARADEYNAAEIARQQLKGAFTASTARRSYTKERVESVIDRPLSYSFVPMFGRMNEIIHSLAWQEWLIDVNRLLRNKEISSTIWNLYGGEYVKTMKKIVRNIAEGEFKVNSTFEGLVGYIRHGATIAGLGFNLSTALINFSGLTQTAVTIRPKYMGKGLAKWLASPRDSVKDMQAKSEFMKIRGQTINREINEMLNVVNDKNKLREKATAWAFYPIVMTQVAVDTPTWWGAYYKALDEGKTEDKAIALADQAVIDSQSSGMVKDLSAIQQGGPLLKLFTTFYSYFNSTYNLTIRQTKKTNFKDPMDVMRLATDYLLLYTIPSAIGVVIRDMLIGGEDDPEELAKSLVAEHLSFMFGTMVLLRELGVVAQTAAGVSEYPYYSGPAGLRLIGESLKLAKQVEQGDIDEALVRSSVNTAGILLHLPAAQTNRTIAGIKALSEGETDNPLSVLFGPPKD